MTTANECFAASDWLIGKNSSASININLTIPKLLKIGKIKDANLNSYSGHGDISSSSDFYISSNFKGSIRISAIGNSSGGKFELSNGSDKIPFSLSYGRQHSNQLYELEPRTPLSGINTGSSSILDTKENSKYHIAIKETDLANAEVGQYSGTITILVAPD